MPESRNTPSQPSLERHARKCAICRHPDRVEIDDAYLHWRSPREIVSEYQLAHHSTLYRHADATGLRFRRRENVLAVLDSILEQSDGVVASGAAVVRAVRLSAQLTGQWKEPPKTYIFIRQNAGAQNPGQENRGAGGSVSGSPAGEFTVSSVSARRPDITREAIAATITEDLIANAKIRQ